MDVWEGGLGGVGGLAWWRGLVGFGVLDGAFVGGSCWVGVVVHVGLFGG